MRKKKHLRINARNESYDRFYLVNYLEDPKEKEEKDDEWEPISDHEETKEKRRGGGGAKGKNRGEEEEGEEEEKGPTCKCLFCPSSLPSVAEALTHCSTAHAFDLKAIQATHSTHVSLVAPGSIGESCSSCRVGFLFALQACQLDPLPGALLFH